MTTISVVPRLPAQPSGDPIHLPLSRRVPLIKMDTVIAARGESADVIHAHVEKGRLHWVFNVAAKPRGVRDLRFWNREIAVFSDTDRSGLTGLATADVHSVVAEILGTAKAFRPTDACLLLGIRRPTLMALRCELGAADSETISRQALERFLIRRRLK